VNPVITWRSDEMFTMWDDCIASRPARTRPRAKSLSLEYVDRQGKRKVARARSGRGRAPAARIDHLDGVLAVDRAIVDNGPEGESLVMRRSTSGTASPSTRKWTTRSRLSPRSPERPKGRVRTCLA
jgi:hypothetical protein